MAEINLPQNSNKKTGVKKLQKHNIKVDLTPMVDLGFLLITFFVFTTSMNEPKAMTLSVPDDSNIDLNMPVKVSSTLSITANGENAIDYYEGELQKDGKNLQHCTWKQLRDIIIHKRKTTHVMTCLLF